MAFSCHTIRTHRLCTTALVNLWLPHAVQVGMLPPITVTITENVSCTRLGALCQVLQLVCLRQETKNCLQMLGVGSWVALDNQKGPYSYLRHLMVSWGNLIFDVA